MVQIAKPHPIFKSNGKDVEGFRLNNHFPPYKTDALVVDSPFADLALLRTRLMQPWLHGEFLFSMGGRGWYVNKDLLVWELGLGGAPIQFDVWNVDGWFPIPFTYEGWRVTTKSTKFNKSRGWARRRIKGYRVQTMPEWHAHLVLEVNWGQHITTT
jgi:hypothetical protein